MINSQKRQAPLLVLILLLLASACVLMPHMPTKSPRKDTIFSGYPTGDMNPSNTNSLPGEEFSQSNLTPTGKAAPTPTITPFPPQKISPPAISAFGIDYSRPGEYLQPGNQSKITNQNAIPSIDRKHKNIDQLNLIFDWLHEEFTSYSAGGDTIGRVTVEDLMESRSLGGCHDFGLIFSAAARANGFPAVMVEAYRISWIRNFQEGISEGYQGHIFVEVYLDNHWILVDPTSGDYVAEGYDPSAKVIPLSKNMTNLPKKQDGYYVDLKGVDSWAMGITSVEILKQRMEDVADSFQPAEISFPAYTFQKLD